MTYMFIVKCALKLVEEIILYYDARSKKHQNSNVLISRIFYCLMNNDTFPQKYNNPRVSHVEKILFKFMLVSVINCRS